MAGAIKETKGPVGAETEPVPNNPGNLADLAAAQAQSAELLGQMGTLLFATAARGETLAQRVALAEQNVGELVEVVRQMQGLLQTALMARRL